MTRIGIVGHSDLTADCAALVADALRAELAAFAPDDLVGVSCLTPGTDQLFARTVLDLGGTLEVVLPATDYRSYVLEAGDAAVFDDLLAQASAVCTMPFEASSEESHLAAVEHLMSTVDMILVVWDRQPAAGRGGAADAIDRAHSLGLPVTVVWPEGAVRR